MKKANRQDEGRRKSKSSCKVKFLYKLIIEQDERSETNRKVEVTLRIRHYILVYRINKAKKD